MIYTACSESNFQQLFPLAILQGVYRSGCLKFLYICEVWLDEDVGSFNI